MGVYLDHWKKSYTIQFRDSHLGRTSEKKVPQDPLVTLHQTWFPGKSTKKIHEFSSSNLHKISHCAPLSWRRKVTTSSCCQFELQLWGVPIAGLRTRLGGFWTQRTHQVGHGMRKKHTTPAAYGCSHILRMWCCLKVLGKQQVVMINSMFLQFLGVNPPFSRLPNFESGHWGRNNPEFGRPIPVAIASPLRPFATIRTSYKIGKPIDPWGYPRKIIYKYSMDWFCWEKLQENTIFDGKFHGFRFRFSLKPNNLQILEKSRNLSTTVGGPEVPLYSLGSS